MMVKRRIVIFHMVFDQLDSQVGHEPFGKGMFDSKEIINNHRINDISDIFNKISSIIQRDDKFNFIDRLVSSDGKIIYRSL